ncbi:ComEC/Rec2 family competence protein [Patescibacteria group bacterium]|nr:ComEC/Rec2 family competence protein [Patescibacteria group bacterium]
MTRFYFLLLGLLLLRLGLFFTVTRSQQTLPVGTKVRLIGMLEAEPKVSGSQAKYSLGGYTILTAKEPEVHFGDQVELIGKVGNQGRLYYPEVKIVTPGATGFWWKIAAQIRSKVIRIYQQTMPKAEADLLSGIVLGSQSLDRSFKAKLALVGLTHVVAASGMNVSFFSVAVSGLLSGICPGKKLKFLLSEVFILFYTTMTGFEPPIVRAALMAAFSHVQILTGRSSSSFAGLGVAAFLMLWASPDLVVNPSFLLSFSAMTGQICLSSLRLNLPKIAASITSVILQSLAALVATFPIVLIFFANFSLIALFTNAVVLWTIEPLMVLGTAIATLGIFFMPISQALGVPAQGLLDFFLWVVNTFGQSDLTQRLQISYTFQDNLSAFFFAAGYYTLLVGGIWFWRQRRVLTIIKMK